MGTDLVMKLVKFLFGLSLKWLGFDEIGLRIGWSFAIDWFDDVLDYALVGSNMVFTEWWHIIMG